MNVIDTFGPKIAKTQISQSDNEKLHKICLDCDINFTPELDKTNNFTYIQNVKEQGNITELLKNSPVYYVLLDKIQEYLKNIDSGLWQDIINTNEVKHLMELKKAWYNKQTDMEYTSYHDHRHTADVVCVLYPKIYLDKDEKYFEENKLARKTGQLFFIYGEPIKNDFGKTTIVVQPQERDMYIFPSTLGHYTSPVLGESERYSISCNFVFTSTAERLLQKYKKKAIDEN